MPANPPPVSYSDKGGYRDNVDDVEALASRALRPISDFAPSNDYDDHSITSSDEDDDDDEDMSLSDEEGQRDATALLKRTSDILNEFEDFVQDVDTATASMEIRNTLTGSGGDTVKSRITAGGGEAGLSRDWSRGDRNLHDVSFGCDEDYNGGYDKYEKRGFFKYAIPLFHNKKFRLISAGVAVVFVLMLIVGSMSSIGDQGEVGELDLGEVAMVEEIQEFTTVYIDTSTCVDIPDVHITTDGHTCEDFIAHVGRVNLHNARCSHESPVKNTKGETLLVRDVCRFSCGECGDAWTKGGGGGKPQAQAEGSVIESPVAVATEPEAPKPEASTTVSIDTSTCEDLPTAIITTDGHTCEDFIAHVGRVPLHNSRCSHESPVKNEKGETLLVKDVCRLSCGVCGDAWTHGEQEGAVTPQAQMEVLESAKQQPAANDSVGEMTNWMTPVTLNDDSSSSATSTTDCKDDLTKVVAIGGKNCEEYFSDSSLVHLKELRCSHQTDVKDDSGNNFLFVKDICKKSCGLCETQSDQGAISATTTTEQIAEEPSTAAAEASTPLESPPADITPSTQTLPEVDGTESLAAAAKEPDATTEPEASPTVSIDTSTCVDNPTAIITTDGHTCEDFIAHVGRVPLHNSRCSHESPVKNEKGETLLVKDVCRLSCGECGDAWTKGGGGGKPQAQAEGSVIESSAAVATEPDAPTEPEASTTVSIDTSTCVDNPTAIITTDGHTCEDFIAHVGRVPLHNSRCSHESPVKNEKGETLLVKDVCRLSCGVCGDAWTHGEQEGAVTPQAQTAGSVMESSFVVDSQPDVTQSSLGEVQAQSNSIPPSAIEETKPVESVSAPASAIDETASVESVSSPSIQQNQESSVTEYTATVFTREEGWEGFSSSAAIDFCHSTGRSLCSYEDICPQGMGNAPVGPPAHNTWVPISDGSDWVQIGAENPCEQWSFNHEGSPPWANAGEAIEEITRTLYCCESHDPVQNSENTDETSIQSIPASTNGLHDQQAYNFVGKRFAPVWYDRASGWEGTTYEAAVQFCLSLENMVLCPYEAYCPLGPLTTVPFGGLRDGDSVSLAAAINNRQMWVQVGGVENVCEHANFDDNWGEDGSNEEQTRHVMCCKIKSD